MHAPYLILLAATASLSNAWLHTEQVTERAAQWRKLITRDPAPALEKRLGPYFRCGHDLVWPSKPTDDAKIFQVLDKGDLGTVQNQLLDFCHKGDQIPVSGNGNGQVFKAGGSFVQYCNIGTEPAPCNADDVKRVFEWIQCGKQEAPQMGMGFHTLDDNGAIPGAQPTWGVIFGPVDSQGPCHTG